MARSGKHLPQKNKEKKSGKAFIVIIVIFLVLVLIYCVGLIVVHSYLNKISRVDDNIEIVPPEEQTFETDDEIITEEPVSDGEELEPIEFVQWWEAEGLNDDELINIMLVGQDSRGNYRERSDAMILCSINPDTGEVAIISFLRDLYVQMPDGYMDNRMNAAYAFGGFPFLYDVMQKNFGITCDGGIEVNFQSFKDIVDLVGGIDIELTAGEANIIGTYEGLNHLDGQQALDYVRIRKLDSDFGRTDRQRNVLNAILEKVRDMELKDLFTLVNTCTQYVTTDMTNAQIIDVAFVALPLLKDLELQSYRIPTDDAYYMTMIRGMSVLVPDLELCQNYLKEDFLPLD